MTHQELMNWLSGLPHDRPVYHDREYYCAACGEPWESTLADMSDTERKMFRAGLGCPSCNRDDK